MKDIEGIENVLQILKPHWPEIEADFERHNERFLELAATDHDAIGRVLRAHLIVENFINGFLMAHYGIPDIKELKLTFFQKAKLLPSERSSAAYVKPGILQLNAVRNKFGHRLDHQITLEEITAIETVLRTSRPSLHFESAVEAIEAFAPIACAFLSVPPAHLQQAFIDAFAEIRAYENVVAHY